MKFAAAATTPGRANIVQYGTEPSAKSTQSGVLFGSPHSRASAWPGAAAKSVTTPKTTTRSRFTASMLERAAAKPPLAQRSAAQATPRRLLVCANEETTSSLFDQDAAEACTAEEKPQLTLGVVEDRAVVDHLVAHLPDRALEPVPAREARDGRARGQLGHAPDEKVGVRDVVEEAECDRDVERSLEQGLQEVAVDERHLVAEALQALGREVEHLRRDVRVHPLARAGLEDQLADAPGAAADVEHPGRVVLADDLECEVAALQQPGANRPLERMLR